MMRRPIVPNLSQRRLAEAKSGCGGSQPPLSAALAPGSLTTGGIYSYGAKPLKFLLLR
jgi:hypothetical protein